MTDLTDLEEEAEAEAEEAGETENEDETGKSLRGGVLIAALLLLGIIAIAIGPRFFGDSGGDSAAIAIGDDDDSGGDEPDDGLVAVDYDHCDITGHGEHARKAGRLWQCLLPGGVQTYCKRDNDVDAPTRCEPVGTLTWPQAQEPAEETEDEDDESEPSATNADSDSDSSSG